MYLKDLKVIDMPLYTVCYTETTARYADIEAPSKKAAIKTMEEMLSSDILYSKEEVINTECNIITVQD